MTDQTARLTWKSYGDTGYTTLGEMGRWRIVTCGRWWHLTLQPEPLAEREKRGKFVSWQRAQEFAQEREDGVPIVAAAVGVGEPTARKEEDQ